MYRSVNIFSTTYRHGSLNAESPLILRWVGATGMAKAKGGRTKNETLSLRIDPRIRHRLDLLTRLEDRTITSVIDRMASHYFESVVASGAPAWMAEPRPLTYAQLEILLWSDDEAIRLARYALSFPDLLNARERVMSGTMFSRHFAGDDGIWTDEDLRRAGIADAPAPGSDFYRTVSLGKIHRNWHLMNEAADDAMESGLFRSLLDAQWVE